MASEGFRRCPACTEFLNGIRRDEVACEFFDGLVARAQALVEDEEPVLPVCLSTAADTTSRFRAH